MVASETLDSVQATNHTAEMAFKLGRGVLVGLFGLMLITALHPGTRSEVRNTLVKDFRTVVSTATGDLAGDGSEFTVAKVKTRDTLSLEIYRATSDGSVQMIEKIQMPDKRDAYFKFNGEATNLAIDDIDDDGRPEILVPSFDENLVGRLNVYHYNVSANSFDRVIR